jgi:hypothetical protein
MAAPCALGVREPSSAEALPITPMGDARGVAYIDPVDLPAYHRPTGAPMPAEQFKPTHFAVERLDPPGAFLQDPRLPLPGGDVFHGGLSLRAKLCGFWQNALSGELQTLARGLFRRRAEPFGRHVGNLSIAVCDYAAA